MTSASKALTDASPIVSSAHLVSAQSAQMSEFEFGLIVAGNAFHRWVVHCMSAAGLKDLTPLERLSGGMLIASIVVMGVWWAPFTDRVGATVMLLPGVAS